MLMKLKKQVKTNGNENTQTLTPQNVKIGKMRLISTIFRELREKHGDTYETPQFRLWARMIQCGTHDDYDDPPRVPMITGILPKRPRKIQ